jgi:cytochrome d ubiquinol oxidase subunit II
LMMLAAGVAGLIHGFRRGRHLQMFLGSCAVLASSILLSAVGMYPTLLRSNLASGGDLTTLNAASGRAGLASGFWWWAPAMLLATGYFVFLFRMFRGKASGGAYGH